jgi:hypothetical protein
MGIRLYIILLCAIPHVGWAQNLSCSGQNPTWVLSTNNTTATFTFERKSDMNIMQDDTAIGADHTRAMTLVGPRDSAIVVTTTAACENQGLQATILTQRGQSPIVLTGCCQIQP